MAAQCNRRRGFAGALLTLGLCFLFNPRAALAWGYQGHRVVGSIAFAIKDKREALLLLTHFVGDLHQPLHVGAVYLDTDGKPVDPDLAHRIDPATETVGGNAITDQNVNLHAEWDDIPFDLGDKWTNETRAAAKLVPAPTGPVEDWPAIWAGDTILVARSAFACVTFTYKAATAQEKAQWLISYEDHTAYLWMADQIKRRELAKAGARLAQILNAIWRQP